MRPPMESPLIGLAGESALADAIERRIRSAAFRVVRFRRLDELAPETLDRAAVLLLTADDDAANVDLALEAKRLKASLHLVVRVFDSALGRYLAETLDGIDVLSVSAVAAPVFVDASLRALASAQSARTPGPVAAPASGRRRFRFDPVLLVALGSLFVLVFPSALVFSRALDLRYLDALYFVWTTVMTVGYGDIALKDASDALKLYGMALMLAGAAFIAVLFALLSDFVLSRRLDLLRGRRRVRGANHVIIVGAGNVGFRTTERLVSSGRRLVIIERNTESRNAAELGAAGHHVVFADATNEDMLALAGLPRAALVLAVTDVDAVNLQIALHARRYGVPVVMRVVSSELSAHVSGRGDWTAISPVASAADAFARAALKAAGATVGN